MSIIGWLPWTEPEVGKLDENLRKLEKEQEDARALIERHDNELFAPIDPVPIESLAPDPEPSEYEYPIRSLGTGRPSRPERPSSNCTSYR